MSRRLRWLFYRAFLPTLPLIFLSGCFSIPFISRGGRPRVVELQQAEFDRSCVFVGYDDNDRPIVELRLINQEVIPDKGLIIHARLFPTDNFHVHNIFRGLRSINYYPIERRFHRLELRYGRKQLKTKVAENLQVRDTKPVDADFTHTGTWALLPDTITMVKLKFQDVKHWGKLPADSLDIWYVAKDQYIKEIEQIERRTDFMNTYRRRQKQDDSKKFTQYDSVFVTTNNTYVYLEKDVESDILFTSSVGDKFDYGVSDGIWMEVPLPDTLKDRLQEFMDARKTKALDMMERQRKAARTSRAPLPTAQAEIDTTDRFTGYILEAMAQKHYKDAVGWEMQSMADPVDVPLFAKVLRDREAARQARLDSIAKAHEDSIKAVTDSVAKAKALADSLKPLAEAVKADSLKADSVRAAAKAGKATAAADSVRPGAAGAAQAAVKSGTAAADSLNPSPGEPGDTLKPGQKSLRNTGPRPSWAGTGRGHGKSGEESVNDKSPADTTGRPADTTGRPADKPEGGPLPNEGSP